jgi:hypothetical protein
VEARCAPHAYVLMTNDVQLLLTPKKAEAVMNSRTLSELHIAIQSPCPR